MNVGRKKVKTLQCDKCPNTFLMVGSTPIGMSRPKPIDWDWQKNEPMTGTCPAHPRSLTA